MRRNLFVLSLLILLLRSIGRTTGILFKSLTRFERIKQTKN